MAGGSSDGRAYNRAAIALHWLIAAALVFQLALGRIMTWRDPPVFAAFQLHKSVGITILALTFARVAVRLARPPVVPTEDGWQGRLAQTTHALLYAFMILAPLSGWALVSTAPVRVPTFIYGLIPLPHLPIDRGMSGLARDAHWLIAWLGAALILLHVAGALRHHLILKDATLFRMWPAKLPTGAIAAIIVLAGLMGGASVLELPTGNRDAQAVTAPGTANISPKQSQPKTVPQSQLKLVPTVGSPVPKPTPAPSEIAAETTTTPLAWAIQPGGRLTITVGIEGGATSGVFTDWTGTIKFDPDSATGSVRIVVRTGSLSFDDASQQSTATSDPYLHSARFPVATFVATDFARVGTERFRADGTLTLKGVSRKQVLTFQLLGRGAQRTANGSADVTRAAFGVGAHEDSLGIAPNVTINFRFDAIRRNDS